MKRIANPIETEQLCQYGCGNKAKFVNGSGNLMCENRSTKCPKLRLKNSEGLKNSYKIGVRKPASLVYDSLPEETKKRMNWNKDIFTGTYFEYGKGGNHKGVLLLERGHKCECCGLTKWLEKPITLELEHVDGDSRNNTRDNLKLLCPNCHSQTHTWKGKNINKSRNYVSDDDFKKALASSKNIRQALLSLGLTPKGANYVRAYELRNK